MGNSKNTKKNSPRQTLGGNSASSQSLKPRAWWQWALLVIVMAGIIGFVAQMAFTDPAMLSLERLQFLIGYAIVLFISSVALGIIEWRRHRRKK